MASGVCSVLATLSHLCNVPYCHVWEEAGRWVGRIIFMPPKDCFISRQTELIQFLSLCAAVSVWIEWSTYGFRSKKKMQVVFQVNGANTNYLEESCLPSRTSRTSHIKHRCSSLKVGWNNNYLSEARILIWKKASRKTVEGLKNIASICCSAIGQSCQDSRQKPGKVEPCRKQWLQGMQHCMSVRSAKFCPIVQ